MEKCKVSLFGSSIGLSQESSIPLPDNIVETLEQVKGVTSLEASVVHLSAEEMTTEAESGYVILLPGSLVQEMARKFYGGYVSGTSAMGPMPNAIALTSIA